MTKDRMGKAYSGKGTGAAPPPAEGTRGMLRTPRLEPVPVNHPISKAAREAVTRALGKPRK